MEIVIIKAIEKYAKECSYEELIKIIENKSLPKNLRKRADEMLIKSILEILDMFVKKEKYLYLIYLLNDKTYD